MVTDIREMLRTTGKLYKTGNPTTRPMLSIFWLLHLLGRGAPAEVDDGTVLVWRWFP